MNAAVGVSGIVVVAAALVAATTDVWKFKVYNVLTIPLCISGLIYYGVSQGWPGFEQSLYGALFGFGVLIIPYAFGGVGAGDVKFLTGIGAWIGMPMMYGVALVGCLATGVYAIGIALVHGRGKDTWTNLRIMIYRLLTIGRYLRADNEVESVFEIDVQEACRGDSTLGRARMGSGPVLKLKMMMWRLLTIGHYLRIGDEIESVQEIARQEDCRSRLVPFSAMMALGALVSLLLRMAAE